MQYASTGHATILDSQTIPPNFELGKPYVLVVDDDNAILSVVMLLLEIEGHAALGFTDSTKVMPFLEQTETTHLPSVILLDLMMPTISGYDIAAKLAGDTRLTSIPIIIMTADNGVNSTSAVSNASDWVRKPFQIHNLLTKLEQFLPSSVS